MTNEQMEDFLAIGEQLGHSRTHLLARGSQTSTVTVTNIEQLRALVRPRNPQQLQDREADISQRSAGRARTLAEHIESYLYGQGELSTSQVKAANGGLPVNVRLVSEGTSTMPHGETVIGPSADPTVWNCGTLNFYSDSVLTVKNTYFTLNVQNLVMQYVDPKH
ncbi:hypothetical protein LMG23992_01490 [Cupriavidus laharis]|uniref:Uncharacterized protein n=1 Tax=Cupriavidus laharis TaxID=151654 RepID=A0ABM8WRR9_9BURK|nr:hypothetical protein [Cupriavidus laharis]CAG9170161.1 hypothetical protein LMG23992_01490 [Cupriavidus laharis]